MANPNANVLDAEEVIGGGAGSAAVLSRAKEKVEGYNQTVARGGEKRSWRGPHGENVGLPQHS